MPWAWNIERLFEEIREAVRKLVCPLAGCADHYTE
jgi:hypothetical protein